MSSSDHQVDMASVCRACMCGPDEGAEIMFSLRDPDNRSLFYRCTAIQVSEEGDDLPSQICCYCMETCQEWKTFKDMCQENDRRLRLPIVLLKGNLVKTEAEEEYNLSQSDIEAHPDSSMDENPVPPKKEDDLFLLPLVDDGVALKNEDVDPLTPPKCPICGIETDEADGHDRHVKSHYFGRTDNKCLLCQKLFQDVNSVIKHTHTHNYDPALHPPAKSKPKTPRKRPSRARKAPKEGSEPVGSLCNICGKMIGPGRAIKLHLETHSNLRPFECKECGAAFKQKTDMMRHVATHSSERTFKCNLCDKTFSYQKLLYAHTKRHNSTETFLCRVCGKVFRYSQGLAEHMNTHTFDRQFVCEFEGCGKVFGRSHVLKKHRSSVHLRLKPYSCTVCEKPFAEKQQLKTHMKVHNK